MTDDRAGAGHDATAPEPSAPEPTAPEPTAPEPEPTAPTPAPRPRRRRIAWWVVGLAIAALVVVVLAPLASGDPDGLERVGLDLGFLDRAAGAVVEILPDYTVPGIDGNLSTILAGLVGVAIVFGLTVGLGRLLARRRRADDPAETGAGR